MISLRHIVNYLKKWFGFYEFKLEEVVYKSFGCLEEVFKLKRYAENNNSLIWDFPQKEEGSNA